MGAYYVGLDVHSRETVFVIQDSTGTVVGRGALPTRPEAFARMCINTSSQPAHQSLWRPAPRLFMWRAR
jgi:hypothetical protein